MEFDDAARESLLLSIYGKPVTVNHFHLLWSDPVVVSCCWQLDGNWYRVKALRPNGERGWQVLDQEKHT